MKQSLKKILLVTSFFSLSNFSYAGFDFCPENSSNEGGSNTFQQQIPLNGIIEVGELPIGISGVDIRLSANVDIDIQLYDKLTGEKIIHWPNGIMAGSNFQSIDYHGTTIEWSGYSGDGSGQGNEFIKLAGANNSSEPTSRAYIMKVFGYKAGLADVNYSWDGANCDIADGGEGSFQQQIVKDTTVIVGDIPSGIDNLTIKLDSKEDVDIQLYDAENGTAIVAWPSGLLSGGGVQSIKYQGMDIKWSGFNGDGTSKGKEYIEISGITTRNLTMKAFGYQSGFATVDYTWGADTSDNNTNNDPKTSAEDQLKAEFFDLINQARSQGRNCGSTFYPATHPVTWNSQLYQAALGHSKDMATKDFFSHTGSNGENAGFRATKAGYTWSTVAENIAAGYPSAESVVTGWLNSPGHCKNIMNNSVIDMAVAKATGGTYGRYWTQVFAKHQ